MPQEDSFYSQAADYKSEIQLKARTPTDILQKPNQDLELYLYVLEIHEHMFFKKVALNGSFLKKKKKNKTKENKKQIKKTKNKKRTTTTTKQ